LQVFVMMRRGFAKSFACAARLVRPQPVRFDAEINSQIFCARLWANS
jgi:hypothetical protein